jgi:YNFM family putative membrane transporter
MATFALLNGAQALLPALTGAFSVSTGESTWAQSLTTAGLGVALLVAGPVSEVLGRTRLIHLSMAASAVVGLACAVAPSWEVFLGLRLLLGVTLAGLPAVATAYLREELASETHARAAGLYVGGTALGGMTGRLLSGAVAEATDWRWAMASVGALAVACAIAVRVLLPPSRNFVRTPARPGRLAAMFRRACADLGLLTLYAIGGCSVGAFIAVYNAIGFRLTSSPYDLGLAAASLVFLVYPAGTLGSIVAGRLADRFPRRSVVLISCVATLAGVALTLAGPLALVVAGLALMTAGFFAVHGVVSGWVPTVAHARGIATGHAVSLYLFAYYAGSSGLGTLGGLAWELGAWPGVVLLAAGLVGLSGLLALCLEKVPSSDVPRG